MALSQTAAGREVIVVTANYRLGALGFLGMKELRYNPLGYHVS